MNTGPFIGSVPLAWCVFIYELLYKYVNASVIIIQDIQDASKLVHILMKIICQVGQFQHGPHNLME
jgi:hypothetical protein